MQKCWRHHRCVKLRNCMAQTRSGPPPIPPRIDLGESEENVHDRDGNVPTGALPLPNSNGTEIGKPQPMVTAKENKAVFIPKHSSKTTPNESKPISPPVSKPTKPAQKKDEKSRPSISVISARPMDEGSSFPSVHFKTENTDIDAQESKVSDNITDRQSTTTSTVRSGVPNKPSKPAPRKPPAKPEDKKSKPADTQRKAGPAPSLRSKSKNPKTDSGSVFYIDTSAGDTMSMDTNLSSSTTVNNSLNKVQKSKPVTSQPNAKTKPSLPGPRKPKPKDEPKTGEIDPVINTKVKLPEKAVSKPKLKPTIITAKTPKPLVGNKPGEVKITSSESINTSSTIEAVEENRPSRPSFPPSANTEENKNVSQPERPKAPPNTNKDQIRTVEKSKEQKKDPKKEQLDKKRPKSKPPRPPMAKESARLKPSRPAPAKPNVTRKTSLKSNDASDKASAKSAVVKPSGPPCAQAKFDYAGETDDDLAFKAGDTIMLTSKIDDDWFVGYLENNVMHQGLFPASFVEIIVPMKEEPKKEQDQTSAPSEPHAVAIHDFQGEREGELSFSSGQTIILLERINVEWLKGKLSNSIGIFPANFVKIEHDIPVTSHKNTVTHLQTNNNLKENASVEEWCEAVHDYQGEQADDLSFVVGTKIKITERVSEDWFRGEYSSQSGIFPASFVQVITDPNKVMQDSSFLTAIHDYPGENPDDLSFKTGDKIKVIEQINSDWFMGECKGKQGLFPASFVEALHSESTSVMSSHGEEKRQTKNIRVAKAIHEFAGENPGELHFSVGDVIQVLREIDSNWSEGMIDEVSGIFPTAFVEFQPLPSKDEVYAKALYDFTGESEQDLSFKVQYRLF